MRETVIIQTKGRNAGRFGVFKGSSGRAKAWITWGKASWILPYRVISSDLSWLNQPRRITAHPSFETLRRYGVVAINDTLLEEWRRRYDTIENDDSLGFMDKCSARREVRDSIAARGQLLAEWLEDRRSR